MINFLIYSKNSCAAISIWYDFSAECKALYIGKIWIVSTFLSYIYYYYSVSLQFQLPFIFIGRDNVTNMRIHCIRTQIHTNTEAYMWVHARSYTHIRTHTNARTRTQTQSDPKRTRAHTQVRFDLSDNTVIARLVRNTHRHIYASLRMVKRLRIIVHHCCVLFKICACVEQQIDDTREYYIVFVFAVSIIWRCFCYSLL